MIGFKEFPGGALNDRSVPKAEVVNLPLIVNTASGSTTIKVI